MTRPLRHEEYEIPWETPDEYEGIRLVHRKDLGNMSRDKFHIGSSQHRVVTLSLWLWARHSKITEPTAFPKDDFMSTIFDEDELITGHVTKHFVGKILSWSLRYSPRFQRIRKDGSVMCWRLRHPAEIRYAMEHHVALWYAQFCVHVARTHESLDEVHTKELAEFFRMEMRDADLRYVSEFFGKDAGP